MKNTNKKTILLELVAAVLVIGVIGAVIGLFTNGLKEASDALNDAFGDLQQQETETSDSTDTTVPADDTKLTYAEGEIKDGVRVNSSGYSGYSVLATGLKANTTYKVSWSIKSTYTSYGFYMYYADFDGVNTPCITYTTSSTFSGAIDMSSTNASESSLLNTFFEFTTTSDGYIELMLLRSDDTTTDAAKAQLEVFRTLINYVEIEEVA